MWLYILQANNNALFPGGVQTALTASDADQFEKGGYIPEEISNMRMGRYADPKELAEMIAFSGTLTYSVEGLTQTSIVVSMTKPRRAQLNRFLPNDQNLPFITRWNALIEGHQRSGYFWSDEPTRRHLKQLQWINRVSSRLPE
ncbi:hypothetical protein [Bacillus salipaludis]|uniref:hypothetical protein n=1 Tax=Bacillus salipaludis TaxID=2547811 RepID=UPI002E1E82B1|nr:hypothetical protein [Bacillus salipaludis]